MHSHYCNVLFWPLLFPGFVQSLDHVNLYYVELYEYFTLSLFILANKYGCLYNEYGTTLTAMLKLVLYSAVLKHACQAGSLRPTIDILVLSASLPTYILIFAFVNKNLAIANTSRISCAHTMLRESIGLNITLWPWNLGQGSLKVTGNGTIG